MHPGKGTCMQPSKLKLLLGHHLATNSFGLGRLFYKSSRQLQNFRRHGDQNGPNLEGWYAKIEPKSKRKANIRKSIAPCKEIQDSLGFRIPCCGFRIPGTGFRIPKRAGLHFFVRF